MYPRQLPPEPLPGPFGLRLHLQGVSLSLYLLYLVSSC
jgi:hypothetical protein